MSNIIGQRLRIARVVTNLTQAELAKEVTASTTLISLIERGKKKPGEILLHALGEVLGFHPSFFLDKSPKPQLDTEIVNFRHRASTSKTLRVKVAAKATLFAWVAQYLDELLDFPEFDVPEMPIGDTGDFERIANLARTHWGLGGDTPITNMVRVAENSGVIVTEMEEAKKVDAFSSMASRFGIIVLNTSIGSSSRSRFDIAHELAHLIMHRDVITGSRKLEKEADRFAAAFLLPKEGFILEFRMMRAVDWPHLFELKRRWKTSVAAIVHRSFDLGLIGAVEYRRRFQYLSARGWRSGIEPDEPPSESPELFENAIRRLAEKYGLNLFDAANTLGFGSKKMKEISRMPVPSPVRSGEKVTYLTTSRRFGRK